MLRFLKYAAETTETRSGCPPNTLRAPVRHVWYRSPGPGEVGGVRFMSAPHPILTPVERRREAVLSPEPVLTISMWLSVRVWSLLVSMLLPSPRRMGRRTRKGNLVAYTWGDCRSLLREIGNTFCVNFPFTTTIACIFYYP